MDENKEIEKILRLCESDQDAGLEFIKKIISENPELKSYSFLKFCKARAYQIKEVQPLIDRQCIKIRDIETRKLCSYLSDKNLDYLELALLEIRINRE